MQKLQKEPKRKKERGLRLTRYPGIGQATLVPYGTPKGRPPQPEPGCRRVTEHLTGRGRANVLRATAAAIQQGKSSLAYCVGTVAPDRGRFEFGEAINPLGPEVTGYLKRVKERMRYRGLEPPDYVWVVENNISTRLGVRNPHVNLLHFLPAWYTMGLRSFLVGLLKECWTLGHLNVDLVEETDARAVAVYASKVAKYSTKEADPEPVLGNRYGVSTGIRVRKESTALWEGVDIPAEALQDFFDTITALQDGNHSRIDLGDGAVLTKAGLMVNQGGEDALILAMRKLGLLGSGASWAEGGGSGAPPTG